MKKSLKQLGNSPVAAVRADTSIGASIRIMREQNIGALVITSDNAREDIVGIFTERDLLKNLELLTNGAFWESAIRTVMTSPIRTITPEQIHEAPKIMARHKIRHLPIVKEEKGKKRLVGVVSMRDLFRIVMEQFDYDLNDFLHTLEKKEEGYSEMVGIFSQDKQLIELVDQGTKFSSYIILKSIPWNKGFDHLADILKQFKAIMIDLDGLTDTQKAKIIAQSKSIPASNSLYFVFTPLNLKSETSLALHKLAENKQVHLLAKPIAMGLLYEKFIKLLAGK